MYIKEFTRDYTMISEEVWFQALTVDIDKSFQIKVPEKSFTVSYFNNGVIELWVDEKVLNSLTKEIEKEAQARPEEFNKILDNYLLKLEDLQAFFKNKKTNKKDVLNKFITKLSDIFPYFVIAYYIAEKSLEPKQIREKAQEIRREDTFFSDIDRYIRASLIAIYPELTGLETIILKKDLQNMPAREVLEKRFKNLVLIPGKFEEIVDLKTFVDNNKYTFDFPVINRELKTLKGIVAYPGTAKGRVRIIRRNKEIANLQTGEILVSPMTTPDYLLAMKKAVAIITDEGGALCHAAIIARELKKPCVIGTRIATQVLKDGDIVELNADEGVVRIIKRK